jgi:hypothetical protein
MVAAAVALPQQLLLAAVMIQQSPDEAVASGPDDTILYVQ